MQGVALYKLQYYTYIHSVSAVVQVYIYIYKGETIDRSAKGRTPAPPLHNLSRHPKAPYVEPARYVVDLLYISPPHQFVSREITQQSFGCVCNIFYTGSYIPISIPAACSKRYGFSRVEKIEQMQYKIYVYLPIHRTILKCRKLRFIRFRTNG